MSSPHHPSRRALLRGAGAACALVLAGCAARVAPAPAAGPPRLRLLGETLLPHRLAFEGTTVGGLSAIDHDPATGTWVALSDDRSELQPARFYTLDVALSGGALSVQVRGVTPLRQADGQPYPKRSTRGEVVDPEAMRLLPGGRGVLWASEGDWRIDQSPGVRESRMDGALVRNFEIPPAMRWPARPGTGARNNAAFEGLALTPDAGTAWVAMEGALAQDGPLPGVGHAGGPCRITAFDVAAGRPLRQFAYLPDALPFAPTVPGAPADNGISEILMLDAHRMLVLERAYAFGRGTSLRLYEIDTREAGDTLARDRLRPGTFQAPAKRLVADFAQLGLSRLDNTEGMCWGPRLANGQRSLVVVSDDNFRAAQVTQFAAFAYEDSA